MLIKTRLGNVLGEERKSRDGKVYYAFTKIPYAKPPVGELRFKNPVKVEPWPGTLVATRDLPLCVQIPSFIPFRRGKPVGQEDCLYLSVYTPQVGTALNSLPVMVYIHGGAFRCGDVGSRTSPDYFMDENVVMVNFHYRLAALGFLSTENSVIPGNFGLKDQAMALNWIHENIDSFGGDRNKITVFGESSGGISTHFLAMSPLTKDIIKGVISESGAANKFWGFGAPGYAKSITKQVAKKLGCEKTSDEEILKFLQGVTAERLVNVELDFMFWDFDPACVFPPVQEAEADGAFMPFDPLITETHHPWLTGIVAEEGNIKLASLLKQNESVTQEFIDHIDDYIAKVLYLDGSVPEVKQTVEMIKQAYFPKPITIDSARKALGNLLSDGSFIYPMGDAIRRHKGPLYQYCFDYRGANSLLDPWGDLNLGVSHADELLYLFNWKQSFPKKKEEDEQLSRRLVKMWANFGRYQNPTPDGNLLWPEGSSTHEYLHISETFSIEKDLKKDIIDWWTNLPINVSTK